MTEIKKQRVIKWIEALRSGKFKQGKIFLKKDNCYCCLGVACELSELGQWTSSENDWMSSYLGATYALPAKVQNYYGLHEYSGTYFTNDQLENNLAGHNDGGMTFAQIADLIEECLENREKKMFV